MVRPVRMRRRPPLTPAWTWTVPRRPSRPLDRNEPRARRRVHQFPDHAVTVLSVQLSLLVYTVYMYSNERSLSQVTCKRRRLNASYPASSSSSAKDSSLGRLMAFAAESFSLTTVSRGAAAFFLPANARLPLLLLSPSLSPPGASGSAVLGFRKIWSPPAVVSAVAAGHLPASFLATLATASFRWVSGIAAGCDSGALRSPKPFSYGLGKPAR